MHLLLRTFLLAIALLSCLGRPACAADDTLDAIQRRSELIWGADAEGGGPYVYSDAADPRKLTGFEVELADALAEKLGVQARCQQGPWDNLPALLGTGQIDIVLNGYELTPARAGTMAHTIPYYIYELALLARRGGASTPGTICSTTLPVASRASACWFHRAHIITCKTIMANRSS